MPGSISADASTPEEKAAIQDSEVADPESQWSPFQWFLHHAGDSIFSVSASERPFTRERLRELAVLMTSIAPTFLDGLGGAHPDEALSPELADALVSLEEVESLEGYPDAWLNPGKEIFGAKHLPPFRVRAINRRSGPDEEGVAALLMIHASHAVAEGNDLVQLLRSRPFLRNRLSTRRHSTPLIQRLGFEVAAAAAVPIHLVIAHLTPPARRRKPMVFRTVTLDRDVLENAAKQLGVRKRSLLFALVTHSLRNTRKKPTGLNRRAGCLSASYIKLESQRHDCDDAFLQARAIGARLPLLDDFEDHVHATERCLEKIEQGNLTRLQFLLNAILKWHRRLATFLPFFYGERFFQYHSRYELVLTLVPPVRHRGPMSEGLVEPVYMGAFHRNENLCAMVAGSKYVTFTFSIDARHSAGIDRLLAPLEKWGLLGKTPTAP